MPSAEWKKRWQKRSKNGGSGDSREFNSGKHIVLPLWILEAYCHARFLFSQKAKCDKCYRTDARMSEKLAEKVNQLSNDGEEGLIEGII